MEHKHKKHTEQVCKVSLTALSFPFGRRLVGLRDSLKFRPDIFWSRSKSQRSLHRIKHPAVTESLNSNYLGNSFTVIICKEKLERMVLANISTVGNIIFHGHYFIIIRETFASCCTSGQQECYWKTWSTGITFSNTHPALWKWLKAEYWLKYQAKVLIWRSEALADGSQC